MHKRQHAQRQHIIQSLDTLLYQLHTLSFFLSPAIWSFVLRLISQFQCSKPRDLDASRSLRFFFAMVLLFNIPTVWNHATRAAAEGRAVVLDFVGLAYVPSKLYLLSLDVLIIFLQLVLTTVAYETSLLQNSIGNDTQDTLSSIPSTSSVTTTPTSSSRASTPPIISDHSKQQPPSVLSPYVIDLRLSPILARLRNPPLITTHTNDASLPLPNTTPWPVPAGMRMLIRASAQMRSDVGTTPGAERRVPGAMDTRDGS